jgi:predicted nucleic acid-binding protein
LHISTVGLRSLDALHLATAISLGDDVGVFFTYDDCLGRAAEENGLTVAQPA